MDDRSTKSVYTKRLDQVFTFIHDHLDADLSLQQLAAIAHFSPYHFHRVFRFMTGETVNGYVTRKRMEQAASALVHSAKPVSAIGHELGFTDPAAFTRTFKKLYENSPSEFRQQHPHTFSKIRPLKRKNGQAYPDVQEYLRVITNLKEWISMHATIEVKNLPDLPLAYVTSLGDQNLSHAFQKLIGWAMARRLMDDHSKLLTVYYDSFKITAPQHVRMRACLVVDDPIKAEGEIGFTTLAPGTCLVARFEITPEEFEKAWTGFFVEMRERGYQKADRPPFEIYHNNSNEHPERIAIVDFCIPIQ